jgi:hypothetical protein
MAKQIINLAPTTELEAVNAMLASIGEAPIDTLDSATQADVVMAINTLRNTAREIQSMGWRFNTEFGVQVAPNFAYDYLDSSGITTRLGVYSPPQGLVAFEMTQSSDQQGTKFADAVLRPKRYSLDYQANAAGLYGGVNVAFSVWFAGTRFGAIFQSTVAQAASIPITVTFDVAVSKVTVTCTDPTFNGNSMTAYDVGGNPLGTVAFDYSGTAGINLASTKSITAEGIRSLVLTPAPLDYVGYIMVITPTAGQTMLGAPVFYDRARNRDGWPLTERKYLYIDAVFLFDFEMLPETARNYIVVMSSRRLAQRALGSAELASFNQQDEIRALRNLKRDQGENDDYNIFDNADVSNIFGGRQSGPSGVFDDRNTPGPVVPVIT